MLEAAESIDVEALTSHLAERNARIASLEAEIQSLRAERDQLQRSRQELMETLALIERRMFVAKAERVDTTQLELEFVALKKKLDALGGEPAEEAPQVTSKRPTPKGRRDWRLAELPEETVSLSDAELDQLVVDGKAEVIGYEDSYRVARKRGGLFRLRIRRTKYKVAGQDGEGTLSTAAAAKEALPRSMAAPSLLAHVLQSKFGEGLPLFRLEARFAREGVSLDRGTMSRWVEDIGATLGATIVETAYRDAVANASIVATDATGILVQPVATHEKKSQPCKRGHYFTQIFDRDHVFFQYTERETSEAVRVMFKGFEGTVLADAKNVYDVLFRPENKDEDEPAPCIEAACWAHARRGFWEAALGQEPVARESLFRIGRLFAKDAEFRGRPPSEIQRLREQQLRPEVDDFFRFIETEFEKVKDRRGKLRSALGYVVNQTEALKRFLSDGRLPMDNNVSERALRCIAVGRKNWLFVGSDDHARSTGNILSLIASARLHGFDPETYLRDVIRVLAYWPRERYLELAPKYWAATRTRLDAAELAREVGPLRVPPTP